MANPVRVELNNTYVKGNNLEAFVVTGTDSAPLATLADNNGFPQVHALYARGASQRGDRGIHISVVFDTAPHGVGVAVNVYQVDMNNNVIATRPW